MTIVYLLIVIGISAAVVVAVTDWWLNRPTPAPPDTAKNSRPYHPNVERLDDGKVTPLHDRERSGPGGVTRP